MMSELLGRIYTVIEKIQDNLVCHRKNFENRLTFGEVIGKSLVFCFFTDGVCGACDAETDELNEMPHYVGCRG